MSILDIQDMIITIKTKIDFIILLSYKNNLFNSMYLFKYVTILNTNNELVPLNNVNNNIIYKVN